MPVLSLPSLCFGEGNLYTTIGMVSKFSGKSNGTFTVDGSGINNEQLNTYERCRFVFLHEVGHNVAMKERDDSSEESANAYANMVLRELRL